MACLDTTVLVDLIRRRAKWRGRALAKVAELSDRGETLATTRFNLAELYVGVHRSDHPDHERRAVEGVLHDLEILEFDGVAAQLFGRLTALLQQSGTPAGDMDVLIAATAMVRQHSLITRNPSHYANIPALTVEAY